MSTFMLYVTVCKFGRFWQDYTNEKAHLNLHSLLCAGSNIFDNCIENQSDERAWEMLQDSAI